LGNIPGPDVLGYGGEWCGVFGAIVFSWMEISAGKARRQWPLFCLMDEITKPKHYTQGPIECLDAIDSMLAGDGGGGVVDFYRA